MWKVSYTYLGFWRNESNQFSLEMYTACFLQQIEGHKDKDSCTEEWVRSKEGHALSGALSRSRLDQIRLAHNRMAGSN